ncbi:hypothetical protein G7Y89_g498 [Cudoniella acicularis]|uniref:Uncharacterized protein n=1 Tax=Cudoniella acicularis TaxID=354080 RepID=A0A8H4WAC9_9HELO|nr:hypothetical protein G7Y89_g498 [Cudoniella acicularis]
MTTQPSDGVAFEQKIQPVPSSDKMALDLDINGHSNSNRDETNFDSTPPEIALNKPIATSLSPSRDDVGNSNSFGVNGAANSDAYSSNQTIDSSPIDGAIESQPTEGTSPSDPNSSHLQDADTTMTKVETPSVSTEAQEDSLPPVSVDSAIDSAFDDLAAPSTVPPVIIAQESDLQHSAVISALNSSSDLIPAAVPSFGSDGTKDIFNEADSPAEVRPDFTSEQVLPDLAQASPKPELFDQDTSNTNMSPPLQNGNTPTGATKDGEDVHMGNTSFPPPPSKIAREREDDEESQPSAKRTKTEEAADSVADMSMIAPIQNGQPVASDVARVPITPHETKEIIKILKSAARTQNGKHFRASVRELWPDLSETYSKLVPHQTDLSTMESNLRINVYPNLDAFRAECELLYQNSVTFNGPEHTITASARMVRDSILEKISNIPPAPISAPKKEKKAKRSTPAAESAPRAPPARRQSRGAATNTVPSAAVTQASAPQPQSQNFALDPQTGTPFIRRDSTKTDGGRPKREIHPPKNKDLPYSIKPKSKKFATELKFCEEVLAELKKPKHNSFANPFLEPVDPVALNIPHYFTVIKHPMDISTVSRKLKEGSYGNAKEFEKDVRQIFTNCYKFNPVGNAVREMGKQFENLFNTEWEKQQQWIADHTPTAASPSSPPESEDEESEEEDEQDEPPVATGMTSAALRLIEEQKKLIELMTSKKADAGIISMQQAMIDVVQAQVDKEKQQRIPTKKAKKPKVPKPKKAAPPPKKATSKKSSSNRQNNRFLSTLEKEVISAGLTSLPDDVATTVLDMIKSDQPSVGEDGTLELDIDQVSVPTLWKIHGLIMEYAPEVDAQVRKQFQERETPRVPAKPATKKKNKPMSKNEQERNIEKLKNSLESFERQASGSQEPVMPTVEHHEQVDSSGDESSDSEEE